MVIVRILPVKRVEVTRRQRALDVRRPQRRQETAILGAEAVELHADGQGRVAEDALLLCVDDEAARGRVDVCAVWGDVGGPFVEELGRTEGAEARVGA